MTDSVASTDFVCSFHQEQYDAAINALLDKLFQQNTKWVKKRYALKMWRWTLICSQVVRGKKQKYAFAAEAILA